MSGPQVLPFYILCDSSKSMTGERIRAVNDGLPEIQEEILNDPIVDSKAMLSVISFSTEAMVDLPLTRLSSVVKMPTLTAGGQTNYRKGMELARKQIEADVARLISEGFQVLRPCVYFITDGRPGDSWKRFRDDWIDKASNSYAPNVIGFGVAGADENTLKRLATQFSFVAREGVTAAVALREIMKFVTGTMIASAREGTFAVRTPLSDEYFRVVPSN